MEINPWDVDSSPEPAQRSHKQLDIVEAATQAATFDATVKGKLEPAVESSVRYSLDSRKSPLFIYDHRKGVIVNKDRLAVE